MTIEEGRKDMQDNLKKGYYKTDLKKEIEEDHEYDDDDYLISLDDEEYIMKENYKRFREFWDKARNITDEDGDNFLECDKSNIGNHCFTEGYSQGSLSKQKDILKILDEIIKKYKIIECNPDNLMELRVEASHLIYELEHLKKRIEGK